MELKSLQAIVIDALEDIKAQDIRLYDTTPLTSLFDRVVIVSGTSNRQTRALASHVREKVKEAGGDVISVEGEETGEWVLVDLADIVVHVMQPAIRTYYNLEELWGEHPIEIKPKARSGGKMSARFAQEDVAGETPAAPAKKESRRAAATADKKAKKGETAETTEKPVDAVKPPKAWKSASQRATPAGRPSTAGRKSALGGEPARKPAAKKAAPKTGTSASRPAAPKLASKKPAVARPAAKKPAAKKPAAKKPAAR